MATTSKNAIGRFNVFVSTCPFGSVSPEPRDILNQHNIHMELNPYGRKITQDELKIHIAGKHALIAGTEKIDKSVLDCAENLQIIARVGIGLDNIDYNEVKHRGILLTYTPEAVSQAVAELTIANMLNVMRFIPQIHEKMKSQKWQRVIGAEIAGKTIGIIGFGRVGTRVVKMLQSFCCDVLVNDIAPDQEIASRYDVQLCSKDEIYRRADIISLHVPKTPLTRKLITKNEIVIMKPTVCLINTSRGGMIDECALYDALKKGSIGAAAIDVFEKEPYSGPLCELDNIILTAHSGSCSREARRLMEIGAAKEVARFISGQPPICPVPDDVIQMEQSNRIDKISLEWHEIVNKSEERDDERYKTYRMRWRQYPTHSIVGQYPLNVDIELVHNHAEKYKHNRLLDYFLSPSDDDSTLMDMSLFQKIVEDIRHIPNPVAVKLGVRGSAISHPHFLDIIHAIKETNFVETITTIHVSQLNLIQGNLLDAIVNTPLNILNVFVDMLEKREIPFDLFTEIKKRKSLCKTTWPQIRIIGNVNSTDQKKNKMFADFWGHWADIVALVSPLDFSRKVREPGWDCLRLWQRLMISANGSILPSNFDIDEQFKLGRFPNISIQEAWLGLKMNKLRATHMPEQNTCRECDIRRRNLLKCWDKLYNNQIVKTVD